MNVSVAARAFKGEKRGGEGRTLGTHDLDHQSRSGG